MKNITYCKVVDQKANNNEKKTIMVPHSSAAQSRKKHSN